MATRRGARELERMQQSADMQMDVLILKRVMDLPDDHPSGLVSKVKQYARDMAWDGTRGMALYEKTATAMMSDGFGSPRDAFPEVYADVLEQQDALLRNNQEQLDRLEAEKEERHAWAVSQQYQEVDSEAKAESLSEEGLRRLSEQQAAAEKRMGGIVQRLAKRAMDKVVDTVVAFDNSIDAVAAKSKSMWSSVTDAIKSKKTRLATLAAAAIVAGGLTGNMAQAADVPQADIPTTHAEMMQSMHEGRMEQMEQDIQEELQRGMHEARADHMEQQLKQEAMSKFSSHLQSIKEDAIAEFSEGLDDVIEAAEKQFEYSYHVMHSPAFQDEVLSNPGVQDELMKDVEVRNIVRHSPDTQNLMMDMEEDDVAMQILLKDETVKQRVAELPAFKRMLQDIVFVDEKTLDNDLFMSRIMDVKGVTESIINDPVVKMVIMGDEVIQDKALDIEPVKERVFASPETKKRVLEASGVERILKAPEVEQRVMSDLGREVALDLPEPESRTPNIEQKVRTPDIPERKVREPNVPEPKVRQTNAQFLKYMEADTITYNDLDQKIFDSGMETSVQIAPSGTSDYNAEITAYDIQFMVEREGVDFSQFLGEIEANGSPELVDSMKKLVESTDREWDTSGYSKEKDPNQFVVGHTADKDRQKNTDDDMVMTSARG